MPRAKKTTNKLRNELYSAAKVAQDERANFAAGMIGSKQKVKEGPFTTSLINKNNLIEPPYNPDKMYTLVESSSILPQCVDAMVQNVDGFGYELKYIGLPEEEGTDNILAEKKNIEKFFDRINEKESFRTLRIALRRDIETTGNGFIEVIRFMDNSIGTLYHMDARLVRLQAKQEEPVKYSVKLWRNGKLRDITILRRFRKYAMATHPGERAKLRWFKEFGDPRKMCAVTGDYEKEGKIEEEASEVLHFKIGHSAYGVPRWSGQVISVLGMNSADFVNWDLFENQVVPPLVIMVSGGMLTAESVRDIKRILLQKKGVENFNKTLILEAQSEGDINDKSGTKIELKELSVARKEDAMFVTYTDKGEHRVRSAFRIPPLFVGRSDTYSKSTADSSKMIGEEQVFVPERATFDEIINLSIMSEIDAVNWAYASRGPRLITGIEVIEGFKEFSRSGIFTINEGIRLANRLLNMDITPYEQSWANFPIPIVVELVRMGVLKDIEEISSIAGEFGDYITSRRDPLPTDEEDISEDEKNITNLYRQLVQMRCALRDISDRKLKDSDELEDSMGFNMFYLEDKEKEPDKKEVTE